MPLILPSNSISGGYEVANSLRFDDGSSDYLNRTPGGAGNRRTWTWSCWFKRSTLGTNQRFFSFGESDGDPQTLLKFTTADKLKLEIYNITTQGELITNRVFRDVSAWFHLVVAIDTTNGTAGNRMRIYINGVEETSFSTDTNPSLNTDTEANNSILHRIGNISTSEYFDGYMAEVCLIDGSQLDPTSFGEFDSDSGIWKPIDVSGLTYGTNGFYLPFENSGALGQDDSGNANNFTVNNLTSIDQTTDTPTNNYATWNPLIDFYPTYTSTLSNGNLSTTRTDNGGSLATIMPSQGKWYMEAKCGTVAIYNRLGVVPYDKITDNEFNPDNKGVSYQSDGDKVVDGTASTYGSTYTTGDIIGIALNLDDGEITFYKNGVAQNSGTPITGFTYDGANSLTVGGSGSTWSWDCNFGNAPFTISSGNSDANGYGNFEYAVPSGYYALNTKNLAEYG